MSGHTLEQSIGKYLPVVVEGKYRLTQQFYRWVHHFNNLQHPNFRIVRYEDLVTKPESQIRDILNFCDLPWQQACLQVENNSAPVSTASKVQVREPINTRSIGRWRRYQPHTERIEAFFSDHFAHQHKL